MSVWIALDCVLVRELIIARYVCSLIVQFMDSTVASVVIEYLISAAKALRIYYAIDNCYYAVNNRRRKNSRRIRNFEQLYYIIYTRTNTFSYDSIDIEFIFFNN